MQVTGLNRISVVVNKLVAYRLSIAPADISLDLYFSILSLISLSLSLAVFTERPKNFSNIILTMWCPESKIFLSAAVGTYLFLFAYLKASLSLQAASIRSMVVFLSHKSAVFMSLFCGTTVNPFSPPRSGSTLIRFILF